MTLNKEYDPRTVRDIRRTLVQSLLHYRHCEGNSSGGNVYEFSDEKVSVSVRVIGDRMLFGRDREDSLRILGEINRESWVGHRYYELLRENVDG